MLETNRLNRSLTACDSGCIDCDQKHRELNMQVDVAGLSSTTSREASYRQGLLELV